MFVLGRVMTTPAALEFLSEKRVNPVDLLLRHVTGDWGDLNAHDRKENENAVQYGERIFSSYKIGSGKVWVITERDRSLTTILMPEDY